LRLIFSATFVLEEDSMEKLLHKHHLYRILLACGLVLMLLQAGCASFNKMFSYFDPAGREPETAEGLVRKGMYDFNHGKYRSSLEIFEKLKERYPFSEYSLLAELKTADSQYFLENYQEALLLYQEFEERHPSNEAIPYIMFQIGMCHYKQIDTIDRDTSGAVNAIQAFSRLLKSFPVSPYTAEAQARIIAARNFLANHEYYVATFYVRTKSYSEGEARLEYLLDTYPDTEVAPQAHTLLTAVQSGNPPKRSLISWLPNFSLPDWRIFGHSEHHENKE
jgi:outer membrane protein assembly factor BamD